MDEPINLWSQQTSRPVHSVTIVNLFGGVQRIDYVDVDGVAVIEGDIAIGSVDEVARGKLHLPGVVPPAGTTPVTGAVTAPGATAPGTTAFTATSPASIPLPLRVGGRCAHPATSASITSDAFLWKAGRVPYALDAGLSQKARDAVAAAIADFHSQTCIRLSPRTTESDYLHIFPGGGCYSFLGRRGGRQNVSLGAGCEYKGIAMHELMHALGFYHEHMRSDRDILLTINPGNIAPQYQSQFIKLSSAQNRLYGDLDLASLMTYDNYAFSNNGQKTLEAKSGQVLIHGALKPGFSAGDVVGIRALYGC
ncbi:M12 family metallopeptidase [Streptosporangium sp. CA-135522]|uniref:M12 family metallopeptidase n=1 Tax=Streptosporangium sp. CA-135522 TaxID=3240072 RepID=UPI003D8EFF20